MLVPSKRDEHPPQLRRAIVIGIPMLATLILYFITEGLLLIVHQMS